MQKASSLDQNDNDEPEQTGQENAAEKDADKESTDKEPIVPDGYNPRDYDNLAVSAELKALFKLINKWVSWLLNRMRHMCMCCTSKYLKSIVNYAT